LKKWKDVRKLSVNVSLKGELKKKPNRKNGKNINYSDLTFTLTPMR
jgi:hypothetical protein